MKPICQNWSQWLNETRFSALTDEMKAQNMKWLEAVRDVILTYAQITSNDIVLDIGTGTGLLGMKALEMQKCQGKVIFSDKFQDCLDSCKEFLENNGITEGYEFLLSECEHIALNECTVTKALMRSVLVHIVNKQAAINEIYRVLRHGGLYCAFEPIIRSNTKFWELLHPEFIDRYDEFKAAEEEFSKDPLDPLFNFDDKSLKKNLEEAGFENPEVNLQVVKSNYVVKKEMVPAWFTTPPSPTTKCTKERFLMYFPESVVNKFMKDVENFLVGKEISLKTNAVLICAKK